MVPPLPLMLWHWTQASVSNNCAPRAESAAMDAAWRPIADNENSANVRLIV
jgi:hypothetical protein